jgi:hypothetical protein
MNVQQACEVSINLFNFNLSQLEKKTWKFLKHEKGDCTKKEENHTFVM